VTERGRGNGSGSTYCSLWTVSPKEGLIGHHRKLVPTYDERLVWANGDGAGLRTHQVGPARVGRVELLGELDAAGPPGALRRR
jgi:nitrilase